MHLNIFIQSFYTTLDVKLPLQLHLVSKLMAWTMPRVVQYFHVDFLYVAYNSDSLKEDYFINQSRNSSD